MKSFEKIGGKILAGVLGGMVAVLTISPTAGAMERVNDVSANVMNVMSSPRPTTGRYTYNVRNNQLGFSVVIVVDYDNHTVNSSSKYISNPSAQAFGRANRMSNVGLCNFFQVFLMQARLIFTDCTPLETLRQQLSSCEECNSNYSVTYDFARRKCIVQITDPFSFNCELDMTPDFASDENEFVRGLTQSLELRSDVEIIRH